MKYHLDTLVVHEGNVGSVWDYSHRYKTYTLSYNGKLHYGLNENELRPATLEEVEQSVEEHGEDSKKFVDQLRSLRAQRKVIKERYE